MVRLLGENKIILEEFPMIVQDASIEMGAFKVCLQQDFLKYVFPEMHAYEKSKGFFNDFYNVNNLVANISGDVEYSPGTNKLVTLEHITGRGRALFEVNGDLIELEGVVKKKGRKDEFYQNLFMNILAKDPETIKTAVEILFSEQLGAYISKGILTLVYGCSFENMEQRTKDIFEKIYHELPEGL